MRVFAPLAAAAVLVVVASTAAEAVTAGQAGLVRAKRLGYSGAQAACFSGVFERYASLNPRGGWTIAGNRRGRGPSNTYKAELHSRCGISR